MTSSALSTAVDETPQYTATLTAQTSEKDDTSRRESIVSTSEITAIECLPTDAMNLILSYCTFSDYRNLSSSSTRLYSAVSKASHLLMEEVGGSNRPAEYDSTLTTSSHHSTSTSSGTDVAIPVRLDASRLTQLLNRFQYLDTLQLDGLAAVGDDLLRIINASHSAKTLTSLSLNGLSLTYWCTDALNVPNLKHLRIAGGSIRTSLGKLFFQNCAYVETLLISQCSSFRDDQLKDIVEKLEMVDNISNNNPASPDSKCSLPQEHKQLTQLQIHQCLRIRKPVLQFKALQSLSLMGCFALTDLPKFNCPALLQLDLSFCFRLPTSVIQEIVGTEKYLPNLQELILIKCAALDQLTIESTSLKRLNVNFCNSLKRLKLACPSLERLDNVACGSLDTLILDNAFALRELSVSALTLLRRLEIFAANLYKLNLSGCRKLESCIIHCPKLEKVIYRGSRLVALRFCKEVREVIMKNWTVSPLEAVQ